MTAIKVDHLRNLLSYCPETGELRWRVKRAFCVKAGDLAGTPIGTGYLVLSVMNKRHYAHRVAWALHTGEWPKGQIDHINGIKSDNRICNLRDVTQVENQQNRKSTVGAYFSKREGRWQSQICVNRKMVWLGYHETEEAARAAYLAAKARLHAPATKPISL